jgi:hypothetical protein
MTPARAEKGMGTMVTIIGIVVIAFFLLVAPLTGARDKIIGRIADVLEIEPAELLRPPPRRGWRKS